jgi:hypothetical protein
VIDSPMTITATRALSRPRRRARPRAAVAAEQRAERHHQGRRPIDRAARDEIQRRDAVDAHAEEVLETVHRMDIGEDP